MRCIRVNLQFRALPIGWYGVYQDGSLIGSHDVNDLGGLELAIDVSGQDVDLVLLHEKHMETIA